MAIVRIAAVSGGADASQTPFTTAPIDTTGASLLVAMLGWFSSSQPTISDSKGNTWVPLTRRGPSPDLNARAYYVANPVVGTNHTFTVTHTSAYPAIGVTAYSGVKVSAPFDVENGTYVNTNGGTLATGSVTPTQSRALVVTGMCGNNPELISGGTPEFAGATYQVNVGGSHLGIATADSIQTFPAAAVNATWKQGDTTFPQANFVAVFKAAYADIVASSTVAIGANADLRSLIPLAGVAGLAIGTTAALVAPGLSASAAIRFSSAPAPLTLPHPLAGAAGVRLSSAATLTPPGFAAAPGITIASAANLTAPVRFAASAALTIGTVANLTGPGLFATPGLHVETRAALSPSPRATMAGITIGGVDVRARVRVAGVTIRDVLNDAPSTCQLTIEGEAPAVGQSLRVTLGDETPARVLFAGTIQTIDESYEGGRPALLAWTLTAIDDTARANARRPFGNFVETSATTIAETITAAYAPGFSAAGIEAGLPEVSIVFDGADTFIAALVRLATLVGGYCKIEDSTVYLFTVDTAAPPDPLTAGTRFLNAPPLQINTDDSQLRTRVYGKGYGEALRSDVDAGETLLPIQDGANFPPLGGTAIAGTTADGAQSERLAFTGVELAAGGTLVGPGAAPGNAPIVSLAGGAGVDSGVHHVAVVYVTPSGSTLAGPTVPIDVGQLAAPAQSPPVAGDALAGTGPDEGTHSYAVTFVTPFGETSPGHSSNSVSTSGTVGQLAPAGAPACVATEGLGVDDNTTPGYQYAVTFVNANGETPIANCSAPVRAEKQNVGCPGGGGGFGGGTTGGNMTPNSAYTYFFSCKTATGETSPATGQVTISTTLTPQQNAVNVPLTIAPISDPRITGRNIYRTLANSGGNVGYLVATVSPSATNYLDTAADAAITGNPMGPPQIDTAAYPMNRLALSNIPTGPAGTTARRIYRSGSGSGIGAAFKYVGQLSNNTQTTYVDTLPNSGLGGDAPRTNTSGAAVQRVPVSNIPIGPPGVTARRLYRRFNAESWVYLVATIANNTATTYTDTTPNSGRGAGAPFPPGTAVGNQIALSGIPRGAGAVTARELYMTPVGSSVLRRALVIADNTTTVGTITASDATLAGAPVAPIADTSGLTQPTGQVNPGAAVLPLASAGTFRAAGGWVALAGNQVVRYTGIVGQSLVGIPPAGAGAIDTTVLYGSQALPAPMLVGVAGLTRPLLKGSAIHIWIQRDDPAAQAEHAARAGGDGIVEYLITDTRRGVDSLTARCDADLAMFARPIVTVAYATRDLKTKSGKPIAIDLASPRLMATLTIQDVTITEIDRYPRTAPRFTVKASSVRFSLADTLRRLIAAENTGIR